MFHKKYRYSLLSGCLVTAMSFTAGMSHAAVPENLSGMIKIDGSSTVYPITEAVAEEFGKEHKDVRITVGISGTGGGFKKLCADEIDISDASRPIKAIEVEACGKAGVEYVELPVAYDALTVVVNPKNTWASSITVKELKTIWSPEAQGKITTWNQVRAEWPDKPLVLFGAGVDSGTYDYFTEAIVGKEHSSRGDFTSSEDDNVLVQGVSRNENALGFFGLAYYEENKSKLKALPVDDENEADGKGPQMPTLENVTNNVYQPLARPLFIYVRKEAATRPEVTEFISYYLINAPTLTKEVGYIPLGTNVYKLASERFNNRVLGSMLAGGGSKVGVSLETLLKEHASSVNG